MIALKILFFWLTVYFNRWVLYYILRRQSSEKYESLRTQYGQECHFNFILMHEDRNKYVIFVNDTSNVTFYIWNDILSYYYYDNSVYKK